jgi:hypothetical protein
MTRHELLWWEQILLNGFKKMPGDISTRIRLWVYKRGLARIMPLSEAATMLGNVTVDEYLLICEESRRIDEA